MSPTDCFNHIPLQGSITYITCPPGAWQRENPEMLEWKNILWKCLKIMYSFNMEQVSACPPCVRCFPGSQEWSVVLFS